MNIPSLTTIKNTHATPIKLPSSPNIYLHPHLSSIQSFTPSTLSQPLSSFGDAKEPPDPGDSSLSLPTCTNHYQSNATTKIPNLTTVSTFTSTSTPMTNHLPTTTVPTTTMTTTSPPLISPSHLPTHFPSFLHHTNNSLTFKSLDFLLDLNIRFFWMGDAKEPPDPGDYSYDHATRDNHLVTGTRRPPRAA